MMPLGLRSGLALLVSTSVAVAAPSIPLDRFEPAPTGDALMAVPDARADGRLEFGLGARFVYARDPLVMRVVDGSGNETSTTIVDHQLIAHALVAATLGQRLVLDLDLPGLLSQGGNDGRFGQLDLSGPSGADLGDLRLGARIALVEQRDSFPGLALATRVWLPTSSGAFSGSDTARLSSQVVVGHDSSTWLWRATAGALAGASQSGYSGLFGSEAFAQLGLGYRLGPTQLGAELSGATGVDVPWLRRNSTHVEALASVRQRFGPLSAFVAAGPGLTPGAGTPAYRVLIGADLSFEFAPEGSGAGADGPGGGQPTPVAPAPGSLPGASGGAADRDSDGVVDALDACPDAPGDPAALRPGCPPDRDSDGVADLDDHCPDVPGVKSADPERHGCPADRDGDGIYDGEDACPNEKGARTADTKTSGCPESVRVVGRQIVISGQVNFATASDVLAAESSKVLEQVAGVLRDHPDIARLAVDGHTDDVGRDPTNLDLSRRRAIAVVRWLVDHGIDERRLEARGFGARQPLIREKTAEARATNRRVEFQILKRSDKGERGWKDGPIDD